jgi:hypothetical protein
MGRMDTSGEHDEDWRADVRLSGALAERAQQHADETGKPKAQIVREALDDYLPDSDAEEGPRIKPPATEDLQTALSVLQRLAEPNGGTVPRDVALSELAQQFSRKRDACMSTLVQPLADAGYIRSSGAIHARKTLRVVLPSDVPRIVENTEESIQPTENTDDDDSFTVDDPADASETLDELAAAGEEVAESAD